MFLLFLIPQLTLTKLSKIPAFFNVVSKFLRALQTLLFRNLFRKNIQNLRANLKSEFEYSKILAHLPSESIFTEITRWVPLRNRVCGLRHLS